MGVLYATVGILYATPSLLYATYVESMLTFSSLVSISFLFPNRMNFRVCEVFDEYIANRAKLQRKSETKKKDSEVTPPTPPKPKPKTDSNGAHRITSWKHDATEDEMKISNSRSLIHLKSEKKLTALRETKFEEPQLVSGFSELEHTQRC